MVALPLETVNVTWAPLTPVCVPSTTFTTSGALNAVPTRVDCELPETGTTPAAGFDTVSENEFEASPAVTFTTTVPAVLPRVTSVEAFPLPSVAVLLFWSVAPTPVSDTANVMGVNGRTLPNESDTCTTSALGN